MYNDLNALDSLQTPTPEGWAQAFDIAVPDGIGNRERLLQRLQPPVNVHIQDALESLDKPQPLLDVSPNRDF